MRWRRRWRSAGRRSCGRRAWPRTGGATGRALPATPSRRHRPPSRRWRKQAAWEGQAMTYTEVVGEGTLKPDGTLELDQKPNLAPGRVQVVLRQEAVADLAGRPPGDWRQLILETAGQWQGAFERPEQGEYEQRESLL